MPTLVQARRAKRNADKAYAKIFCATYAPSTLVFWTMRGGVMQGSVIRVSAIDCRAFCHNTKTGSTYWVSDFNLHLTKAKAERAAKDLGAHFKNNGFGSSA